jgi:hypothetical protein
MKQKQQFIKCLYVIVRCYLNNRELLDKIANRWIKIKTNRTYEEANEQDKHAVRRYCVLIE